MQFNSLKKENDIRASSMQKLNENIQEFLSQTIIHISRQLRKHLPIDPVFLPIVANRTANYWTWNSFKGYGPSGNRYDNIWATTSLPLSTAVYFLMSHDFRKREEIYFSKLKEFGYASENDDLRDVLLKNPKALAFCMGLDYRNYVHYHTACPEYPDDFGNGYTATEYVGRISKIICDYFIFGLNINGKDIDYVVGFSHCPTPSFRQVRNKIKLCTTDEDTPKSLAEEILKIYIPEQDVSHIPEGNIVPPPEMRM